VKLHELKPTPGSRQKRKRVGRGVSAGQGKTSGRGQKGQGARESNSVPTGFEGGQMKQSMRLPKLRGFHNRFRREYEVVNLSKLNRFDKSAIVDGAALAAAGLINGPDKPVKLLAAGRVKVAVHVRVHRASAAAQRAVLAAGGQVDLLEEPTTKDSGEEAGNRRRARAAARAAVAERQESGAAASASATPAGKPAKATAADSDDAATDQEPSADAADDAGDSDGEDPPA
jgi:large subunit ribosomal protein L15